MVSGHKIVLMKDMFYGRACLIVGYVLLEDMSHGRTCQSGGHIFQDDMFYGSICLMGVQFSDPTNSLQKI